MNFRGTNDNRTMHRECSNYKNWLYRYAEKYRYNSKFRDYGRRYAERNNLALRIYREGGDIARAVALSRLGNAKSKSAVALELLNFIAGGIQDGGFEKEKAG